MGCQTDSIAADNLQLPQSVSLNPDMTFSAEVGGVQSSVLVDTGSTINLLSKTVYDVLPNKSPLLTTKTKTRTALPVTR